VKSPLFFRSSPKSDRRGFTLMEMLIVLTIIALLMGMVIFQIADYGELGKMQKVQTDILGFKEMLAAYQLESGSLPTTEQGLKALWSKPTVEPVPQHWRKQLEDETKDPWGHSYIYLNPGKHNPDKYDIYSLGPDGLPDTEDDIGNWKTTSSSTP
jgi:general secretion pathway protein G